MITLKRGALRGTQLQNGALCLESWQVAADYHVVLALREHSFDPYVVWDASLDGNCSRGDYCQTIQEAVAVAEKRAGL
jgi:hypothetical protein